MKNKGRRHRAGVGNGVGAMNCKGGLTHLTRPITSMATGFAGYGGKLKRFDKKKWSKRVRGYFKSQTKDLLNQDI